MSEAKHTPGTWRSQGGHVLASLDDDKWTTVFVADCGKLHANAERIVACVNACQGIDPAAVSDLLAAQTMGAQVNTPDFLDWVADRLVHVYGESPNVDFVLSLRYRAAAGRAAIRKAIPQD